MENVVPQNELYLFENLSFDVCFYVVLICFAHLSPPVLLLFYISSEGACQLFITI